MTSEKRETLSEYLKRHQNKKQGMRQKSRGKVDQKGQKDFNKMVNNKKEKMISMMTSVFSKSSKLISQRENCLKLQKIFQKAIEQINQEFDQLFHQSRSKTPQFISKTQQEQQTQTYKILINPPPQQNHYNKESPILKQVKNTKKLYHQPSKSKLYTPQLRKNNQETNKNPLIKQRSSYRSKQNSMYFEEDNENENPQNIYQTSSRQDILNKAFDKKQSKILCQWGNGLEY